MSNKIIKPLVPKSGQIMIEDEPDLLLCKPRLIPLKSFTLEKLEKMQQQAVQQASEQNQTPVNKQ